MVLRTHGVQGLVRARPTGPTLAELRSGEVLELVDRDGRTRHLTLTSNTPINGGALLGFDGVETREDADVLRGGTIRVDPVRLPPPRDPDEFYVRELIGCAVRVGGREVGTVRDVINRPANDVLEVTGADGTAQLLPFTTDAVVGIDLVARRIELRGDLIDPAAPSPHSEGGGNAG